MHITGKHTLNNPLFSVFFVIVIIASFSACSNITKDIPFINNQSKQNNTFTNNAITTLKSFPKRVSVQRNTNPLVSEMFSATWCPYCAKMTQENDGDTFSYHENLERLKKIKVPKEAILFLEYFVAKNCFVNASLSPETQSIMTELSKKRRVSYFPTFWHNGIYTESFQDIVLFKTLNVLAKSDYFNRPAKIALKLSLQNKKLSIFSKNQHSSELPIELFVLLIEDEYTYTEKLKRSNMSTFKDTVLHAQKLETTPIKSQGSTKHSIQLQDIKIPEITYNHTQKRKPTALSLIVIARNPDSSEIYQFAKIKLY